MYVFQYYMLYFKARLHEYILLCDPAFNRSSLLLASTQPATPYCAGVVECLWGGSPRSSTLDP